MENTKTVESAMIDTPETGSPSMVAPTSPSPDELTQVVATVSGVLGQLESWTAGIVDSFRENLIEKHQQTPKNQYTA